jgi:hypothetical protein
MLLLENEGGRVALHQNRPLRNAIGSYVEAKNSKAQRAAHCPMYGLQRLLGCAKVDKQQTN